MARLPEYDCKYLWQQKQETQGLSTHVRIIGGKKISKMHKIKNHEWYEVWRFEPPMYRKVLIHSIQEEEGKD